jgi:glucose/arabinose dehydrogenase
VLVVENVDLAALVGDQAYAGFSAATGGLVNRHQILNWQYNTSVPAVISPSTGVQASSQVVASGFMLPTSIAWSPNGQNLYVAEKGGVVRVIRNGAPATVFLDISGEVNSYGDRGLTAVAVHPDLENNPYVYLFYSYDPPEVYQDLNNVNAGPDGFGNRASRLVRVTADVNTNYTTAVPGSEVVILGTNSVWENYNGFVDSTTDLAEPPGGLVTNGSRSDFNGYVILPNGETALAPSANRLPDGGEITFANIRDFIAADSVAHSSADVKFGPDGALYVSIGDGASYNERDPRGLRVQDLDNLSGKILRIDPLTGAGLTDNPFYTGDPTANRSKVYQLGFRNPFRIAISPQGQVYAGDVGWTTWEEINTGGPGANFGWPYFEGGNGVNLPTTGYQNLPVAQSFYANGGEAISSFVGLNHGVDGINALILSDYYTGTAYGPDYVGSLFFNDLGRGLVRNVMLDANGRVAGIRSFASNATFVVSIHQGPDGFLYFVDIDDGLVGRWVI